MPSTPVAVGQVYQLPGGATVIVVSPTTDPLIWYTRTAAAVDGNGYRMVEGSDMILTTQASMRSGSLLGDGTFTLPEGWTVAAVEAEADGEEQEEESPTPSPVQAEVRPTPVPARPAQPHAELRPTDFEDPAENSAGPVANATQRCPACQVEFTGRLGHEHQCARILELRCAHCRNVDVTLINQPGPQRFVCGTCQASGYQLCNRCDSVYHGNEDMSVRLCQTCDPYTLSEGGEHAMMSMAGTSAIGNSVVRFLRSHRTFGVEIETYKAEAGRGGSDPDIFRRKTDGSIRPERQGQECVEWFSMPLRGDLGLAKLEQGVKKIRDMGFRSNVSCGLHVHWDAADLSEHQDLKALAKTAFWYQDEIEQLVSPSRRGNNYCRRMSGPQLSNDRYQWFNLRPAFRKHRTVEVRLHHGITHADRVVAWVQLTARFVEQGLKIGRATRKPNLTLMQMLDLGAAQERYWERIKNTAWRGTAPAR